MFLVLADVILNGKHPQEENLPSRVLLEVT
jgi:hypothetical protein